jgi:hypothetical protein
MNKVLKSFHCLYIIRIVKDKVQCVILRVEKVQNSLKLLPNILFIFTFEEA